MIKRLFFLNLKALAIAFTGTKTKTGRRKGAGRYLPVLLLLLIAVSLFAMFLGLFFALLDTWYAAGVGWMYFSVLGLTVFILNVVSTIFTTSAQIFGAKDNEMLLSMPIRPRDILISRLLVILVYEYAITLIAASAAFILWMAGGYGTVGGTLFLLIGCILTPLMALAVALALAWVIHKIGSKFRRRNILNLVVSLGFMLAWIYVYMNMQRYMGELIASGEALGQAFRKAMPPFYAFGKSIAESSFSDAAVYFLWSAVPFGLAVALISSNYRKILTMRRTLAKVAYRAQTLQAKSVLSALVRRELGFFWSKTVVVLNTALGSLFTIVGGVALLVRQGDVQQMVPFLEPFFGNNPLPAICAFSLALLGSVNDLSASLISLEGNKLWIAKSIPVPAGQVLLSKVCAHLVVTSIPCIIGSLCAGLATAETAGDWLLLLILPQTFIFLVAAAGLAINLRLPRLEWVSEVHVVKQGAAAMITLFGAMVVLIFMAVLYLLLLRRIMDLRAFLWILALLFTAGAAITGRWLFEPGVRAFERL